MLVENFKSSRSKHSGRTLITLLVNLILTSKYESSSHPTYSSWTLCKKCHNIFLENPKKVNNV